jgi:hypothetical protein
MRYAEDDRIQVKPVVSRIDDFSTAYAGKQAPDDDAWKPCGSLNGRQGSAEIARISWAGAKVRHLS